MANKKGDLLVAVNERIKELDNLLTDRISDLHGVKGGQADRHAFVLYRMHLWGIRDKVEELT